MLRHHCRCRKELTRYEQHLDYRKTQLLYSAICHQAQGVWRPQPSASCALVQLNAANKLQGDKWRICESSVTVLCSSLLCKHAKPCQVRLGWVSRICNLEKAGFLDD